MSIVADVVASTVAANARWKNGMLAAWSPLKNQELLARCEQEGPPLVDKADSKKYCITQMVGTDITHSHVQQRTVFARTQSLRCSRERNQRLDPTRHRRQGVK
jgi:hypothetical protein